MTSFELKEKLRLPHPEVIQEAAQARVRPWWAVIAWVLVAYAVWQYVVAPTVVTLAMHAFVALTGDKDPSTLAWIQEAVTLFTFATFILMCMVYVVVIEKRRLRTLGFVRRRALRTYGAGLLFGGATFAVVFVIASLLGVIESFQFNASVQGGILLILLLGYVVQTMSEEVLFRGFVLVSLSARYPIAIALAVSSVAFALLHAANGGITILAIVNIILVGWMLGLMFLKTGDIWLCGGFHCMWNYIQGPLAGMAVSGSEEGSFTLFHTVVESGNDLLSGGSFGLEASIITTVVFVVLLGVLTFMKPSKSDSGCCAKEEVERA